MSEQKRVIITVEYIIWNANTDGFETRITREYKVEADRYISACESIFTGAMLRRLIPLNIEGRPHVRSYTKHSRIMAVKTEQGDTLPLPDLF